MVNRTVQKMCDPNMGGLQHTKDICCQLTACVVFPAMLAEVLLSVLELDCQARSCAEGQFFLFAGMLDVQQIFGRAGRPQFEDEGLGIIITQHAQLAHYLGMLTHQTPIESKFTDPLVDNLNAEIVLGKMSPVIKPCLAYQLNFDASLSAAGRSACAVSKPI